MSSERREEEEANDLIPLLRWSAEHAVGSALPSTLDRGLSYIRPDPAIEQHCADCGCIVCVPWHSGPVRGGSDSDLEIDSTAGARPCGGFSGRDQPGGEHIGPGPASGGDAGDGRDGDGPKTVPHAKRARKMEAGGPGTGPSAASRRARVCQELLRLATGEDDQGVDMFSKAAAVDLLQVVRQASLSQTTPASCLHNLLDVVLGVARRATPAGASCLLENGICELCVQLAHVQAASHHSIRIMDVLLDNPGVSGQARQGLWRLRAWETLVHVIGSTDQPSSRDGGLAGQSDRSFSPGSTEPPRRAAFGGASPHTSACCPASAQSRARRLERSHAAQLLLLKLYVSGTDQVPPPHLFDGRKVMSVLHTFIGELQRLAPAPPGRSTAGTSTAKGRRHAATVKRKETTCEAPRRRRPKKGVHKTEATAGVHKTEATVRVHTTKAKTVKHEGTDEAVDQIQTPPVDAQGGPSLALMEAHARHAVAEMCRFMHHQYQSTCEPLIPSFMVSGGVQRSPEDLQRISLEPPDEFFVDLGFMGRDHTVDDNQWPAASNGFSRAANATPQHADGNDHDRIVAALAKNKVVRLRMRSLKWAENLAMPTLREAYAGKRFSTLLQCDDGFVNEYWLPTDDLAQYHRFYARDLPTPEDWRDELMEHLPEVMRQNGKYDFRRHVPLSERGDNHDVYVGWGRFAAGLHIDEGRLMGVNGCAKGQNSWYFVHPSKTQQFENAATSMLADCDRVWAKHQPVVMNETQFRLLLSLNPSLQGHVFKVSQRRGEFLLFPSGWGHQVVTEGPPTMKVAWALMPYHSLSEAMDVIDEYRQEHRILVDNAGKAIINGAKQLVDDYREGEAVHLMTVEALVNSLERLCEMFDRRHELIFKHRTNVADFVGESPYCDMCNTAYFYFFSTEVVSSHKVNRCYRCTLDMLGDNMRPGHLSIRMHDDTKTRHFDFHAEHESTRGSIWVVLEQLRTIRQHGKIAYDVHEQAAPYSGQQSTGHGGKRDRVVNRSGGASSGTQHCSPSAGTPGVKGGGSKGGAGLGPDSDDTSDDMHAYVFHRNLDAIKSL